MNKEVSIPLGMLEGWLAAMEHSWYLIDSEFGPADGGLDGAILRGEEPEIEQLRLVIAKAKRNPHNEL